jgi:restriction system protein
MESPDLASNLFISSSDELDTSESGMSGLSAVERLLIEAGTPLNYLDITKQIIQRGFWKTEGKTPEATINAQLAVDIQKHGCDSRFQRTEPGVFALRAWGLPEFVRENKPSKHQGQHNGNKRAAVITPGLAHQISEHNEAVHRRLHELLHEMPASDFEKLIGDLLIALGFEDVEVTHRSGDGGIDVRGILVVGAVIRTKMAVQVKRWKNNVQAPIVQQVRGSLGTHDQGLIVTTSNFSSGAKAEAERANAIPVALMNGQQLVRLLIDNNMGVRRTKHDLIELDGAESL